MKTKIQALLQQSLDALKASDVLPDSFIPSIKIDHCKDKAHGDLATNVALMASKQAKRNPRELAQKIIDALPEDAAVEKVEIAGPGFINFFLAKDVQTAVLKTILDEGNQYGRSNLGKGEKVLVEFVSANPTGPLHVGHGRGASFGAAVSDLLEAVGYSVDREYYVNDAGRQMNILATSIWLRYLLIKGLEFPFPVNGYKGDYVADIAKKLTEQEGDALLVSAQQLFENVPEDLSADGESGDKEAHIDGLIFNAQKLLGEKYKTVFDLGLKIVLDDIREDLLEFGVEFQSWFSEQTLMDSNALQHSLDKLKELGFTYEKEGAVWFKSESFGDDKDRVLVRADGRTTYFASDVAYHLNKIERGYTMLVDVFGADHHGYVTRLRAAMRALDCNDDHFIVPLVQFASLYRSGEKVQMSTRSGSFVTIRELRDEIGTDAARFFYVMRKVEQHMDFDLDLAKSKSNENPVYYIQYAHARVCSVMRQLEEKNYSYDQAKGLASLALLTSDHEKALLTALARYPEVLQNAAKYFEPHALAVYLREFANYFHTYYNAEQFIVEDEALRNARLVLINAVKQVLSNGLTLLSVSAPEKM
jgi:arginyl-tRNA synthetase